MDFGKYVEQDMIERFKKGKPLTCPFCFGTLKKTKKEGYFQCEKCKRLFLFEKKEKTTEKK
jgi:ribosomal protein L37AE/L43A